MKEGDEEALNAIWSRYFERLRVVVRNRLKGTPRRHVEDEEVALGAMNALWDGAQSGRFERLHTRRDLWEVLVMLASRRAIDHHRRTVKRSSHEESVSGAEAIVQAGQAVMRAEPDDSMLDDLDLVSLDLLDLLDDRLKSVAVLRLRGFSNEEIATRMKRSTKSVERYLVMIRHRWLQVD